MKKIAVIYVSKHHGNTEKLLKGIDSRMADRLELIPLSEAENRDFSDYDMIGLASGIYGFELDPGLTSFALSCGSLPEEIFIIYTSGIGKDGFAKGFIKKLKAAGHEIVGTFQCKGYDTFGPLRIVGGIAKGHPDEEDIISGTEFIKELTLYMKGTA